LLLGRRGRVNEHTLRNGEKGSETGVREIWLELRLDDISGLGQNGICGGR